MKKIKLGAFLFGLIYTASNAQNIMPPEPTTSSISNYVNAAASPATGVPNIGFPLYQLETINKNFPVNLGLSYHVYNAKPNVPAGEAGLGWSVFTSGTISRRMSGTKVDEYKNWTDVVEEEADIFYYNIPGHSGKFKIYKDTATGNLILNNLSVDKIKIEYERDLSNTKLVINSFTITDDNGFVYLFQDYNLGYSGTEAVKNYKSTFALTKVLDANGQQVVSYVYEKKIKYIGTSTVISYQYSKINTISTGKGKLKFTYDYNTLYDNPDKANDPYELKAVSLTDNSDRLLSKYQFVYGSKELLYEKYSFGFPEEVYAPKRILQKLQKLDKNLNVTEETSFEYDDQGSDTQYGYYPDLYGNILCVSNSFISPKKYTLGLLKKVTFPTKGYIIYSFEANTEFVDKSLVDYSAANAMTDPEVQYYDLLQDIAYDTNTTRTYQFQVPGTAGVLYPIYINHEMTDDYGETDTHGNPILQSYTVKSSDNTISAPNTSICTDMYSGTQVYMVKSGTATITVKGGGNGFFKVSGLKSMPKPYKNEAPVKYGARVKTIQSFDADGTLVKTKKFEYTSFTGATGSSGYSYSNENCMFLSSYDGFMLYKNVKETEISGTENNGYNKYYYKIPSDYQQPGNNGYYLYYDITSDGILEKKEVYNKQNQVVESSEYEYTMQEVANAKEYNICLGSSKPSWLQYVKEISKTYLNQSPYQTISETTFSADNFKESYSKATAQDGSVTETTTKYATDLGNTRFINKNIISTPLEVETKTDGTVMAKVTTKYDNTAHFYPTSLEKTDLAQNPETQMTFDLYDDKGNLVQMTDKAGNSVTTIWGYYKTLPIAQIVGVKYNDISSLSVVTAAVNASNADADNPANEAALLTALNNLRLSSQLQGYSMTVYSYDPLVGVTNSISSNGIKKSYEYDASGRLLKVKNSEGQLIKENQYNYKH